MQTPDGNGIIDVFNKVPLFDDLFLYMQALNIHLVDSYLQDMEAELLAQYEELEKTPVPHAMFVSAISQMWVFGFYELLRTWRQWARELIQYADRLETSSPVESGQIVWDTHHPPQSHIPSPLDLSNYYDSFKRVESDKSFVQDISEVLDLFLPLFRQLEKVRIALAKHEVAKSKMRALAPGYGRIDGTTGSIYWVVLDNEGFSEIVSRRSLADDCRKLLVHHKPRGQKS